VILHWNYALSTDTEIAICRHCPLAELGLHMIFGLIETTTEWYQSDAAILRFRDCSVATAGLWLLFLFLHFRPSLLGELQASMLGKAAIIVLGMFLALAFIVLAFGMGWYLWRLDNSPTEVKILWLLAAALLSPFVEGIYFLCVYRSQVLSLRRRIPGGADVLP
jgi:hypothetical protein